MFFSVCLTFNQILSDCLFKEDTEFPNNKNCFKLNFLTKYHPLPLPPRENLTSGKSYVCHLKIAKLIEFQDVYLVFRTFKIQFYRSCFK